MELIYEFIITVDFERRKHNIKVHSFEVQDKSGITILLKDPKDLMMHSLTIQEYSMINDKSQVGEWKQELIRQTDLEFSGSKPFSFTLWLKSDKEIMEFQYTDMIISMVKSHLYSKRHPFG